MIVLVAGQHVNPHHERVQAGSWHISGFLSGFMCAAAIVAFVYWRYRTWLDAHFRRHATISCCTVAAPRSGCWINLWLMPTQTCRSGA